MPLYSLRRLVIPVILLIAALFLRDEVTALDPVYRDLMDWLPYVILGGCLVLSAYYNRSRIFTASLLVLFSYYLIQTELQVSLSETRAFIIFSLLSLAFPFTFLILLLAPERGLRNRYGMLLLSVLPIQFLLGIWVLNHVPEPAVGAFLREWMSIKPFHHYVLSLSATTAFVAVSIVGILSLVYRDGDDAAALLTVLLFSFITLVFFNLSNISMTMFSAMGLSIIIGMLGSSHDMAYRDDLTGLLGRRALNDRLRGLGRRYVIAMMDVDHFKKFNDTYGHDVGDDVLKVVAKQISAVKGGGVAYRYGGEEFCIVFPGKDIEYCEPFLEDVRRSVEAYRMALRDSKHRPESKKLAKERRGRRVRSRGGQSVSVTISIGMAERGGKLLKPDEVMKAADAALYKAKKSGRNCLAY